MNCRINARFSCVYSQRAVNKPSTGRIQVEVEVGRKVGQVSVMGNALSRMWNRYHCFRGKQFKLHNEHFYCYALLSRSNSIDCYLSRN